MHKETMKGADVWGIEVPLDESGRRSWPDEIKHKVVARVAAGAKITAIAKEIGATPGLVSKWSNKDKTPAPRQSFVEVSMASASEQVPAQEATCTLRIGDVTLEVQLGFPVARLTDLIRAARASL